MDFFEKKCGSAVEGVRKGFSFAIHNQENGGWYDIMQLVSNI